MDKNITQVKSSLLEKFKDITPFFGTKYLPLSEENLPKASGKACFLKQVHGNSVLILEDLKEREFLFNRHTCGNYDSVITKEEDTELYIKSADCMPILLYDPKEKVIAAVHSGWRSTLVNVLEKTLEKMVLRFSSNPENIYMAIGPSIHRSSFEVGKDVFDLFLNAYPKYSASSEKASIFFTTKEKFFIDLQRLAFLQGTSCKIPENQIEILPYCTYENEDLFFSYRRTREKNMLWSMIKKIP